MDSESLNDLIYKPWSSYSFQMVHRIRVHIKSKTIQLRFYKMQMFYWHN